MCISVCFVLDVFQTDVALYCVQVTYNSLINACARANKMEEAFRAFESMEKAGVRGNEVRPAQFVKLLLEHGCVPLAVCV